MDVPDLDAFTAAMQTAAAVDAMSYDGVMPETLVIIAASECEKRTAEPERDQHPTDRL
jgi:hypothetical protein